MKKYEAVYHKLKEKYTDEEIVENFLIPEDATEEEDKKIQAEFGKLRMARWQNRTAEERLLGDLLSLKYIIKSYIKREPFQKGKTFSSFLKEYMKITDRRPKVLAEELSTSNEKFLAILENKEKPDFTFSFRLERHSGDIIPALYWWKLSEKEIEHEILTATEKRDLERLQVKKVAYSA